jgi:son of sevenless-like protein
MDWRTLKHDTSNEKIEFEEDQRTINCATLGALVEQMTHNINYDIHILHEFFVTFRSFTDASALFQKLSDRFNTPPPPNVTHEEFAVFKEDVLAPIRLRVTSAIKYWVENFYTFDFRGNEDQLRRLDVFIQMVENSNSGSLAKVIKRSIEKVVEDVLEKIMRVPSPMRTPSIRTLRKIPTLKKTPRGPKSILKNYHRKEIARQLALIDFEMFSKIEAKECLNSAWTKESRETMAPNIHAMTQFFNRISAWVGTEVVKVEKLSDRVRAVCKVIKVAKRSYDLHNYNAVFSVMSGLNSSPIHRLRQTWDALPKEYMQIYDELSELMSRDGNFKNLRTALKDGTPPSIPYVGLYLKDLTFIEDGSPKYITRDEVKMINFSKCRQFAAVIRDIQTFQNQRYAFEVFPELRELLLNPTVMTEQEMYDQSLLREARVLDRKSKAIMNRGSSLMNK